MGTRHHQAVINRNGETKISQYGQWDGYPEGQGIDILRYLRDGNLEKYHENVCKIEQATEEQLKLVDSSKNWDIEYPYLSRNCGSNIHQMIEDGNVKFVSFIDESEAKTWCEGFYTIDFKNNTFTSEYYDKKTIFKLTELPSDEEYLESMKREEE